MNDLRRRVLGYGIAAVAVSTLVWAGFVRTEPPDLWTQLSSIDTQLRLCYGIPANDKQGNALSARVEMLADAERRIIAAEQECPNLAMLREYRGFLHNLRGEYREAAQCYAEAMGMEGVDAEMHDTLVFNQARMLDEAGDAKAALAVYEQNARSMQSKFEAQGLLERAAILAKLDREIEATELLSAVLKHDGEPPMTWIRAGEQLEAMGETDLAEAAYEQASARAPAANYFRARLKLHQGEVDRCLQLLSRALQSAPAEVRRWVGSDQVAWQELEGDARYQQLFATESAPATPGR